MIKKIKNTKVIMVKKMKKRDQFLVSLSFLNTILKKLQKSTMKPKGENWLNWHPNSGKG